MNISIVLLRNSVPIWEAIEDRRHGRLTFFGVESLEGPTAETQASQTEGCLASLLWGTCYSNLADSHPNLSPKP